MILEVISMSNDMLVAFVRNACKRGGGDSYRLWPPRTLIKFAFFLQQLGQDASIVECCAGVCSGPSLGPLPFHGVNREIKSNGIAAMLTRLLTASLPGSRFKGGSTPGQCNFHCTGYALVQTST